MKELAKMQYPYTPAVALLTLGIVYLVFGLSEFEQDPLQLWVVRVLGVLAVMCSPFILRGIVLERRRVLMKMGVTSPLLTKEQQIDVAANRAKAQSREAAKQFRLERFVEACTLIPNRLSTAKWFPGGRTRRRKPKKTAQEWVEFEKRRLQRRGLDDRTIAELQRL